MGVLKLGTVALDGTKIHANASRAALLMSSGKIEAQLKAERLIGGKAEAADQADVPTASIPDELARREPAGEAGKARAR